MSLENCKLCNQESTPYFHINGHICEQCYFNSKGQSWISVKDKLPKNKQVVIACSKNEVQVCKYEKTEWYYFFMLFNTSYQVENVTHWMPLPEPPHE